MAGLTSKADCRKCPTPRDAQCTEMCGKIPTYILQYRQVIFIARRSQPGGRQGLARREQFQSKLRVGALEPGVAFAASTRFLRLSLQAYCVTHLDTSLVQY